MSEVIINIFELHRFMLHPFLTLPLAQPQFPGVAYINSWANTFNFSQEHWQNQHPMERPLWRTTKLKPNCQHKRSSAPNNCHPPWHDMTSTEEVCPAINGVKTIKGILSQKQLHPLTLKIWNYKKSPLQWYTDSYNHLKRERDRAHCDNYHGSAANSSNLCT